MSELGGITVLVTGSTGGVGPGVTDRLVDEGADVIGTYRSEEELEDAKERGKNSADVSYYDVELTDENEVAGLRETLESEHGTVDAVVNLVGGFSMGDLVETGKAELKAGFDRHVTTVFLVLKEFYEDLESNGGGVVNFSSQRALESGPGAIAYNAGKVAVKSLTECVNEECESARINAVAPAIMDTPANREAMPDADFSEWTSPAEVAEVVQFLISGRSSAVEGQVVAI